MERIDSHIHVNFGGMSPENIIKYLDAYRLDACWVLTWEQLRPPVPEIYQPLLLDEIKEVASNYPNRIIPFFAPDPNDPNCLERLENFFQSGGVGCGELKVDMDWDDDRLDAYLSLLDKFKSPLVIHMEYPHTVYLKSGESIPEKVMFRLMTSAFKEQSRKYVSKFCKKTGILKNHITSQSREIPGYLHDFDKLAKRIQQYPNVKFIGHGPHFWNHFSSNTDMYYIHYRGPVNGPGKVSELLDKFDNFYCDISGNSGFFALNRDLEFTRKFLDQHSAKILFGSDNTPHDFIGLLESMKLSDTQLKGIMGKNAAQVMLG